MKCQWEVSFWESSIEFDRVVLHLRALTTVCFSASLSVDNSSRSTLIGGKA